MAESRDPFGGPWAGPIGDLNLYERVTRDNTRAAGIKTRTANLFENQMRALGVPYGTVAERAMVDYSGKFRGLSETYRLQAIAELAHNDALMAKAEKDQNQKFNIPRTNITQIQNFSIKLDLKSDDSPDAVAVKITKALAKVGKHPQTAARALNVVPSP